MYICYICLYMFVYTYIVAHTRTCMCPLLPSHICSYSSRCLESDEVCTSEEGTPTGAGDCTFSIEHAGESLQTSVAEIFRSKKATGVSKLGWQLAAKEIPLDEIEGISDYAAFIRDGCPWMGG